MSDLLSLHRLASVRGRLGYSERMRRWSALHEAARVLTARLPFKWRGVAMDNPTQNHTGYTNGRDHIVLDEAFSRGRLHREAGEALCGAPSANLWNPAYEGRVTCKKCLEMAQRIVEA